MSRKNAFGGGNPNSLYVPMAEDEQEVIQRLVDSQTLEVVIHQPWNLTVKPYWVGVGDKRVAVKFGVTFTGVAQPTPVRSLDLELRAMGKVTLLRKPYPTILPDKTPLIVAEGAYLELQWDIGIDHIDPALVKSIKPGAIGLTSRRLDPVTGEKTLLGNMRFQDDRQKLLHQLDKGEKRVQVDSLVDLKKAEGQ